MLRTLSILCVLLFVAAVEAGDAPSAPGPFDVKLLDIATTYKQFHRVDDQMHLAPTLCRMANISIPRISVSTDEKTHGRKLYFLFAKHRDEYWNAEKNPAQPVGQFIVKEAWRALDTTSPKFQDPHTQLESQSLAHEGKLLAPGEKSGLYIMFKLDPKTEGTDQGWVYGTVSADGKTVTSAGRVASCMKCHEEAKYDRLFGVTDKSNAAKYERFR